MENRPDSPIEAPSELVPLFLDQDIQRELSETSYDLGPFNLVPQKEASHALLKKGDRLWVTYPDGEYCDFPFYRKNIVSALDGFKALTAKIETQGQAFDSIIKTSQAIEKKMFSNVPVAEGQNVKDLWHEVIKKINLISTVSHTLTSLVEGILEVPFLQNYQTSLIILHLKGQTKASVLGVLWRGDKFQDLIEVKDFNAFFNSVKKSKIKSFSTDAFPKVNLPFNGSFLAKEVISKKYSMVAIASRHDFLSFGKDEIDLYETCVDLLQPHFERLVDQEFSDKRVSEFRVCLKDFPLPLRIKDSLSGATFQNDLYQGELQDKDIFFSKKIKGSFSLDLYDNDELRHYAFDLFHFQRISLLGELLNTLRHELSNPLFGLKLGSQIYLSLDAPEDSKEIMAEIEKNVNRCQQIIENFSNLYQVQSGTQRTTMKKLVEEAMVLAKSEIREIRKSIEFQDNSETLELEVPLIFVVQIIFNLIVNASQAISQAEIRGELKILIKPEGSLVTIDVIDNGPGIDEEKQSQLFKPFFTTKAQGTGLGLVLSRSLAVKMGGNLEFIVNNNSKGAHFRLSLPVT